MDVLKMAEADSDAEAEAAQSDDTGKERVARLAESWARGQAVVEEMEDELKRVKERVRKLEEEEIPEAMDKIRMSEFTLLDGSKISVGKFIRASIAKDRKEQVLQWLEDEGHDGIIKTEVSVAFGKGEYEIAQAFAQFVRGFNEKPVEPELGRDVNTATFKSLMTELLEDAAKTNRELPLAMLGVFTGRKAKVTLPRTKKVK